MQGSRETYSLTSCDIEVVCSQTALIAIYERIRGFKQANGNDIMSKLMSVAVLVVPYYPIVSWVRDSLHRAVELQLSKSKYCVNSTTRLMLGERKCECSQRKQDISHIHRRRLNARFRCRLKKQPKQSPCEKCIEMVFESAIISDQRTDGNGRPSNNARGKKVHEKVSKSRSE